MTDTLETLRRKIGSAGELKEVVRTMKALAASSIGQYERAVRSLTGYARTIELGLVAAVRQAGQAQFPEEPSPKKAPGVAAVVFGSDQGLVGQFNDLAAERCAAFLSGLPGPKTVWAVGDRVRPRLEDAGLAVAGQFAVPGSVTAVTPLVGLLLAAVETARAAGGVREVYLVHHRPLAGACYEPVVQRLLPLDETWRRGLAVVPWPTASRPELLTGATDTLAALVREYLFVSIYRACAESLASENASRLAAMQRAERNIDDMLDGLHRGYHRLRQDAIDAELFDVIAGFEALSGLPPPAAGHR